MLAIKAEGFNRTSRKILDNGIGIGGDFAHQL
jgi:hypothetical protein